MSPQELWNRIKDKAANSGAALISSADLEPLIAQKPDLLADVPGNYKSAVVIGVPVPRASFAGIVDSPTLLYFHHYRQVNYALDRIALDIAISFEKEGFASVAIPASQIISWKPVMRGHVSHRLLGQFAGLGWRGRNNLLVNPQYGSQVRYGTILTSADIGGATEQIPFSCGSCRICVSVCPARAIKENPEEFDSESCSEKLREFAKMPFIGQSICGVCVKACAGRGAKK